MTANLYAELLPLVRGEPDAQTLERIVRVCDKILKADPSDVDALRTKTVALVKLERYDDAVAVIGSHTDQNQNQQHEQHEQHTALLFEQAYCMYRTNALDAALALIDRALLVDGVHSSSLFAHLLNLQAQVLYRLERFQECIADVYPKLIAESAAASVAPSLEPKVDTYEVLFNRACRAIGEHNFVDAERFLKKAQ
eukprot:jgi/Hompol1/5523/HPOL_004492-RA